MTHFEKEANQLVVKAEQKLSQKGFFHSIFGYRKIQTDEAIDCYQKAGNLFKLSKNWSQAGTAFKSAADLYLQRNNRIEAAINYVLASKCLKHIDLTSAIKMSVSAIKIYSDLGRFVMVAKQHKDVAQIYDEFMEVEKAVQHYEQAADYYRAEDNYVAAKSCMLKVANYVSCELQDYAKAIDIYEEIAFNDMKIPILRYDVKYNLVKAILCHLCVDVLNAKNALSTYLDKDPEFQLTAQYDFLDCIIETVENADENSFGRAIKRYDQVCQLDSFWHTKILLQIKKIIKAQSDLL